MRLFVYFRWAFISTEQKKTENNSQFWQYYLIVILVYERFFPLIFRYLRKKLNVKALHETKTNTCIWRYITEAHLNK